MKWLTEYVSNDELDNQLADEEPLVTLSMTDYTLRIGYNNSYSGLIIYADPSAMSSGYMYHGKMRIHGKTHGDVFEKEDIDVVIAIGKALAHISNAMIEGRIFG